jgi:hypothetical protein
MAWARARRRLLGHGKEREVGWLRREKRRWFFLLWLKNLSGSKEI